MSKKTSKKRDHYGSIAWYNTDYWLLNGFLLPDRAHSALSELIRSGRFHDLDAAIREGIRIVLEENSALLIRNDRKWIPMLSRMDEIFKNAAFEKPDRAGAEHVKFLNQMYQSIAKAET
jgi:Arc/MetJ-type ribon-helix-helix transcriptional regulator